MGKQLASAAAIALHEQLKPQAIAFLVALNDGDVEEREKALGQLRNTLAQARMVVDANADESYLNDLFVLDRYVDFFSSYSDVWTKIIDREFSASWSCLQDSLDLLRTIKKFSKIDVGFFEAQLTELEDAYPYAVFFSVGMLVDRFDCSICGLDIDSSECVHRGGQLYRGTLAYGIAHEIVRMDHVSMVTQPDDKRCVVQYDDQGEQFKVVRLFAELIESKKWRPTDFSHLDHSVRMVPNPANRALGRNQPCSCGSGRKFKKCCISQVEIERKHVELVASSRSIAQAVK